ncbi:MAG TPA: helix-turn-helix transcriptional regulator [Mycobacteriales bacterium]|nr:helix-turn-helix transcriptional regulator [Mycobacteriales bacterium]
MHRTSTRATTTPRDHLRVHRERVMAWSQARAAEQIGVHPSTLWRWETGLITAIRPYDLQLIARAYGLLFEDLAEVERHRVAVTTPKLGWDVPGTVEAFRALEDPRMKTSLAGLRAGDDLTGVARQWMTAVPVETTEHRGSVRVDLPVVEQLEGMILRLRHLDDEIGGADLLPIVSQRHRRITDLLAGSYTDAVGRRLHTAAADLGHLLGWLAFDTGQHGMAQRQWIAALHACHTAGDRSIGANILAGLAMQSYSLDRPHDGLSLAQTAEENLTAHGSARVRSMLACRQAVAAAKIGDAVASARALKRAEDLLDADDPDAPTWIYYYGAADEELHAGTAWLALDEPQRAENAFLNALQQIDPTHVRDRGVIFSRVAIARIAQGELDGAALVAGEALLLTTAQLHSKRALDELVDVDQALTTADSSAPAVRDFHDHFTAMCAQE